MPSNWFNSPGQSGGDMWANNGPQAPQINNAPARSPIWGAGNGLANLGMMGQGLTSAFGGLVMGGRPQMPQLPGDPRLQMIGQQMQGAFGHVANGSPMPPLPQPPAYGAGGRWGGVPGGEQWQRGPGNGPVTDFPMPQPTGPREAPEAHPGMADRAAGQWASGGFTPQPAPGNWQGGFGAPVAKAPQSAPGDWQGGFGAPAQPLGQWASALKSPFNANNFATRQPNGTIAY